jgi:hypothetical protein
VGKRRPASWPAALPDIRRGAVVQVFLHLPARRRETRRATLGDAVGALTPVVASVHGL